MKKTTLHIPTMACDYCARTIKRELRDLPDIRISLADKTICIVWDESETNLQTLTHRLAKIGYPASKQD